MLVGRLRIDNCFLKKKSLPLLKMVDGLSIGCGRSKSSRHLKIKGETNLGDLMAVIHEMAQGIQGMQTLIQTLLQQQQDALRSLNETLRGNIPHNMGDESELGE